MTESAAELDAIKTGQVVSAYITPSTGSLDQIKAQSNLGYTIDNGNSFEAIWLNAKNPPISSQAVRQAIGYVIDRQAIVDQILKPSVGTGSVLQSFIVPTFKQYYVPAFADYKPDPAKVDSLMTGDGWTKKNGTWTKNGKAINVEISTTSGQESRQLSEEIMRSELTQAGFKVSIHNQSSDAYFGTTVPKGKYEIGIFASVRHAGPRPLRRCSVRRTSPPRRTRSAARTRRGRTTRRSTRRGRRSTPTSTRRRAPRT